MNQRHTLIKLSVWRDPSPIPRCSFCTIPLIPMCYKSVTDVIYITARCRCPCAQCAVGHWGENCFVPRCSAAHTDLSPHPCWIPHLFEIKMQNIPRTTRSSEPPILLLPLYGCTMFSWLKTTCSKIWHWEWEGYIYAEHYFDTSAKKRLFVFFVIRYFALCSFVWPPFSSKDQIKDCPCHMSHPRLVRSTKK